MIKAITFDLWETLIEDEFQFEDRTQILQKTLDKFDCKVPLSKVQDAYITHCAGYEEFLTPESEYRHIPYQERFDKFFTYFNIRIPHEYPRIIHEFNEAFMRKSPPLYKGVKETLDDLAKKYILGIISDTGFVYGHVMRDLLHKYGLLHNFKYLFFSDETYVYKPHIKAFQEFRIKSRCLPQEIMHVGDRLQTDVIGANTVGWYSVHLQYPAKIEGSLKNKTIFGDNHNLSAPDFVIHNLRDLHAILSQIN